MKKLWVIIKFTENIKIILDVNVIDYVVKTNHFLRTLIQFAVINSLTK